ncbi:MAG: metal ABC transporter ATP-binding protein [Dehalococcoidia bacterium]|nr:metal ABC transporter ATP-binding protein [Dehalococcoidia bacterium]
MSPSTAANTAALELNNVEAGYGVTFTLRNVSFRAEAGEVVGLIGPNGGGKSTLLKAIAGVLPLRAGTVALGGRPLREYTGRTAFVPQREDVNWEFPATALDVVLMGRYRAAGWFRRPGHADRQLAAAALERLGLGGMGGRHISQFSGGQQQRIFLARAAVQDPLVVLLDEPFTGIDQANRKIFHELIREFASRGCVVLMATHDLDEVASTTTSVACIANRLVAFGPTATTYTPEILRATFGGRVAVFS